MSIPAYSREWSIAADALKDRTRLRFVTVASRIFRSSLCHIWRGCPVIAGSEGWAPFRNPYLTRSVTSSSQDEMGCHNPVGV